MLICDGGRGTCSLFFSFLPSLESSSCVGWQGGSESYQDWIEGVKASCCSLLHVHNRADNLKQRVRWVDECSAPLNWVIGLPALFLSWGSPCSSAFAVLDLCYLFARTGCANTIKWTKLCLSEAVVHLSLVPATIRCGCDKGPPWRAWEEH